ncbi:hypothetical protein GCM10010982_03790 [Bowmanella pacifica]|uniref:Uncharacterized protein n=1 Tax=Bowmanella pacifica TaxID=502051 RepID=A0A917YRU8_9ALTE|nr:hypothetical protein GCM10010982_03790 [Bowmanella pacifica]
MAGKCIRLPSKPARHSLSHFPVVVGWDIAKSLLVKKPQSGTSAPNYLHVERSKLLMSLNKHIVLFKAFRIDAGLKKHDLLQ